MKVVGPERYRLSYSATSFTVRSPQGGSRFSDVAKSLVPKLYIACIDGKPVYVGITKRGMQERLRHGWRAAGESGYYGYQWRHQGAEATLDVWAHTDAVDRNPRDIETVEAEIVFLIRQRTGQWPRFQTEIHFRSSTDLHRLIANQIFQHYEF